MSFVEAVDMQALEQESNDKVLRATNTMITTDEQYVSAMEFAKTIKSLIKGIEETFDPIIKKQHSAWKEAIAQRDKHVDPLNKALDFLDSKGRAFRAQQEALRQEEQRKVDDLARKEAARLESLKSRAEARGDIEKAQVYATRAQEATLLTPVIAPKVSKVEGIKVRKVWKYRIIDANLLPREYLIPNETMLGSVARATKGTLNVPGVQFYSEDSSI